MGVHPVPEEAGAAVQVRAVDNEVEPRQHGQRDAAPHAGGHAGPDAAGPARRADSG